MARPCKALPRLQHASTGPTSTTTAANTAVIVTIISTVIFAAIVPVVTTVIVPVTMLAKATERVAAVGGA